MQPTGSRGASEPGRGAKPLRGRAGRLAPAPFAEQVHDALAHLHDLVYLQTHHLAGTVRAPAGPTGTAHPGKRLQQALMEAIEALRPRAGAAPDAVAERAYRLLELRYLEALPPPEVQRRLAVGRSRYFEEHRRALGAVVSLLTERWAAEDDSVRPTVALQTKEAPSTNLPLTLTSFVGRDLELARACELLAGTRLLTLTGPGGVGKTRLALEAARGLVGAYRDGVWLVELAPLGDEALVAASVADALHVGASPGSTPIAALLDRLRGRRLLLVLDNCEHLVDACAALADALLRSCPGLRVLATSREPLGVPGETTLTVEPLPVPDAGATLDRVARAPSVRLFVARARATRPEFALAAENAEAVAAVARRLDGIPLAIELAAARARALTAEQIAARLDDLFHLLTGGSRTALRRQQTLRATVDWSHDLLGERERVLFRRLSIFAGGWRLSAAEEVCAGEPIETRQVLDLLTQLVDKSLVVAEPSGEEAHYRLLETLRQYAQERLLAAGEADAVRNRHRDWYVALAERAERELSGPRQSVWLDLLEVEHDNLRAALAWCRTGAGGGEAGLRLASSLMGLWYQRGYAREGQAWLQQALGHCGAAPSALRARALNAAGFLALRQGDLDRARVLLEQAVALGGRLMERSSLYPPKTVLGYALVGLHQWDRARTLLVEEVAAARVAGDRRGEAYACAILGRLENYTGAYAAARARFEQAIALARADGDALAVPSTLVHLALALMAEGDFVGARAAQGEGDVLLRRLGHRVGRTVSLTVLGHIARLEGHDEEARARFAEAMRLFRDLGGERRYLSWTLDGVAATAAAGRPLRAAKLFGAGDALRAVVGDSLVPVLSDRNDRDLAGVRAALGEKVFSAAWAEGRAMTPEQAIAWALSNEA